jgi:Tfp pilus assembly protein PilO
MTLRLPTIDLAKWKKDPRIALSAGVLALAAANLVAAAVAFQPWGASVEDLEREAATLRQQIRQQRTTLDRTRAILKKVDIARGEGDQFVEKYLLGKPSLASSLASELERGSRKAGIRQKETTFSFEPIEGSENLTKAVITGTYEGAYTDLMRFLNELDRSDRLLIVEGLSAAPQQGGNTLGITLKLNTIVREDGPLPVEDALADMPPAPPSPAPVVRPTVPPGGGLQPARGFSPAPPPTQPRTIVPQGPRFRFNPPARPPEGDANQNEDPNSEGRPESSRRPTRERRMFPGGPPFPVNGPNPGGEPNGEGGPNQ